MRALLADRVYCNQLERNVYRINEVIHGEKIGGNLFDTNHHTYKLFRPENVQDEVVGLDNIAILLEDVDISIDVSINKGEFPIYAYYSLFHHEFSMACFDALSIIEECFSLGDIYTKVRDMKVPNIEKNGVNLNNKEYLYNPALMREEELKQMMVKLLRDKSVVLTGLPGVGKSAIVEGLAYLISNGEVPNMLKQKVIYQIFVNSLLAGTRHRGEFEEKLEAIIKEVRENSEVILFIDELHTSIGAGSSTDSSLDLANALKPYLARGEITLIGCTTDEEFDKYLASDAAFKSRFARIKVQELEKRKLKVVVLSVISYLERKFECKLENKYLDILIDLSYRRKYDEPEYNPRLIIDILGDIYAVSYMHGHSVVEVDDIIEGINMASSILPSAIDEASKKINNMARTRKNNRVLEVSFV